MLYKQKLDKTGWKIHTPDTWLNPNVNSRSDVDLPINLPNDFDKDVFVITIDEGTVSFDYDLAKQHGILVSSELKSPQIAYSKWGVCHQSVYNAVFTKNVGYNFTVSSSAHIKIHLNIINTPYLVNDWTFVGNTKASLVVFSKSSGFAHHAQNIQVSNNAIVDVLTCKLGSNHLTQQLVAVQDAAHFNHNSIQLLGSNNRFEQIISLDGYRAECRSSAMILAKKKKIFLETLLLFIIKHILVVSWIFQE